jgi:hypothetical protein
MDSMLRLEADSVKTSATVGSSLPTARNALRMNVFCSDASGSTQKNGPGPDVTGRIPPGLHNFPLHPFWPFQAPFWRR